jgi:hypothetical protein
MMAFMMNKLEMINSCKSILGNLKKIFFPKNHCKIQARTILVCALYSIKYGKLPQVESDKRVSFRFWGTIACQWSLESLLQNFFFFAKK